VRRGFLLITLAFTAACFALSPTARAVCQEGCLTNSNTVLGDDALFSLTTGVFNTATGSGALFNNTTGNVNTATGVSALFNNTTGNDNTATGFNALEANTTGVDNTAIGSFALFANTIGNDNTANGFQALFSNTTGNFNTATGENGLYYNTTGSYNTGIGLDALLNNTTGNDNTATGFSTLFNNTTGSNNIALGVSAGSALTTGTNNIDIGNVGVAGEANKIRIGTEGTQTGTFIAGIRGTGVTGIAVKVNAAGQLGTAPSSARFKQHIRPMDQASNAILALKPVTFRYKKEIDPEGKPEFGLVAEDVAKVNPNLVACDAKGEVDTVRYEAVNAMLLNEFLKEHRKVEKLEAKVAQQQKRFAQQERQIDALTFGLQKVNAQLEVSKPAPQTALNNQ
jgi:hypothetical protein